MSTARSHQEDAGHQTGQALFATLTGAFIALCLLKFGNPAIFEDKVAAPTGFWEWYYQAWPVRWAYLALVPVVLGALLVGPWRKRKLATKWPFILLFTWYGWQFVAATHTVDASLTAATLRHFTGCVACFLVGWFALAEIRDLRPCWVGVLAGFAWVIIEGFQQHFGGLERSRQHFYLYVLPNIAEPPADLLKKISSDRIFSTLFYPNTLAAVLLLFLPISVVALWKLAGQILGRLLVEGQQRFIPHAQFGLVCVLTLSAAACLAWSGSKSGWILMVALGVVSLIRAPISSRVKRSITGAIVVIGLGGFALKYAGFFEKGATSVVARKDYWQAAIQIAREHPVAGTGPGTFSVPYEKLKAPDAEMARLCHNDYLEQASDSGMIGFLAYFGLIFGSISILYRKSTVNSGREIFSVYAGVLVVSIQGFSEFNLYIPAIAWPTFLFLGWLLGGLPSRKERGELN